MTVEQWIDNNLKIVAISPVRMMNFETRKGLKNHWLNYKTREIKEVKVASNFTFIFI